MSLSSPSESYDLSAHLSELFRQKFSADNEGILGRTQELNRSYLTTLFSLGSRLEGGQIYVVHI
jgi:hypothetical protein